MNKLSSIPLVTRRGFFSTGALVAFAVSRHCATAAPFVDKWDTTISAYLRDPLWEPRYAYDAGHVLLGPLYAAFTSDSDRRAQFLDHFQRFMDADKSSLATCSLNEESGRIHYLYLATHFLKLSESAGLDPPKNLRDRLIKEFIAIYRDKPVWGYDPTMYNGGIKGRVEKKLATFNSPYRYYNAILDVDLFVMSALALLSHFSTSSHDEEVCNDAIETFAKIVLSRGKYQDNGGWLFQPGNWSDHPDYLYVGNDKIGPNLEKKPISSIAEDSSHSHRFPVFLRTLAETRSTEASRIGLAALNGLTRQFLSSVLRPANDSFPAPRVTNFMDGRNGVYRYAYEADQFSAGYGPFQLSGILPLGWWGFLPGQELREIWRDFVSRFPLTPEVVETYTGPNTTTARHPLVTWPDYFTNGFAEVNVRSIVAMKL